MDSTILCSHGTAIKGYKIIGSQTYHVPPPVLKHIKLRENYNLDELRPI